MEKVYTQTEIGRIFNRNHSTINSHIKVGNLAYADKEKKLVRYQDAVTLFGFDPMQRAGTKKESISEEDLAMAKMRKDYFQAENLKRELKQRKAGLVPMMVIESTSHNYEILMNEEFNTISKKLAPKLASCGDEGEISELIDNETRRILTKISETKKL
jgi:hypothetical protein